MVKVVLFVFNNLFRFALCCRYFFWSEIYWHIDLIFQSVKHFLHKLHVVFLIHTELCWDWNVWINRRHYPCVQCGHSFFGFFNRALWRFILKDEIIHLFSLEEGNNLLEVLKRIDAHLLHALGHLDSFFNADQVALRLVLNDHWLLYLCHVASQLLLRFL